MVAIQYGTRNGIDQTPKVAPAVSANAAQPSGPVIAPGESTYFQNKANQAYVNGKATEAVAGGTKPPTGTLTAQISSPSNLSRKVSPPAVVTSSAASRDLANKKAQADLLAADTAQHKELTSQPTQPVTQPVADKKIPEAPPVPQTFGEKLDNILGNLNEGQTTIQQQAGEVVTPLAQEQQQAQEDFNQSAVAAITKLNKIASGTYPLTTSEKNLLSSTEDSYKATIAAQQTANTAYTGQMTELMASLGIATSAPTEAIGMIHAAISSGESKVADINSKMATKLAELTQGFQTQDYKMVNDAWTATSDFMKERITTLKDMQKSVLDAAHQQQQDLKDYAELTLKTMISSAEFTQKQKQDAIDNSFKQMQISETQRHNLAQEATANRHTYQITSDGKVFDQSSGEVISGVPDSAVGGAATTKKDGSDINQTIANLAASNKLTATTQAAINPILGVINAAKTMAQNNPDKKFAGITPGRVLTDLTTPLTFAGKGQDVIKNEEYINGINLKVQQWASGASLTNAQTKMVEGMVPNTKDTDTQAAGKLNNLVNFMNQQIKATLATGTGIEYKPVDVDLFAKEPANQSLDEIFGQ